MGKEVRHHRRKTRKPNRKAPLDLIDTDQLKTHRELALLRIAGGAAPGKKKGKLIKERIKKLQEAEDQLRRERFRAVQEALASDGDGDSKAPEAMG